MESFLPFFLLLFAGVVFSALSNKLHLPWVIALILGGIAIGPHAFDLVTINPIFSFMAQVGLIFLMFMAGLETKLSSFWKLGSSVFILAFVHAAITFAAGLGISLIFGFSPVVSILVGIIFLSTSVAVVIPSLEISNAIDTRAGKTVVAAAVVADVLALMMLSVVLQTVETTTSLPLPLFYVVLVATLFVMRFLLPRLENLLAKFHRKKDLFQQELRAVLTVLLGTVLVFESLGLHAIIAGFFAGLVLSDSVKNEVLIGKLRALSYGFFIPTFFILVGVETNILVFQEVTSALPLLIAFAIAAIGSKIVSGWLGARLGGFNKRESMLIGVATIPQLSTTLAVVYSAQELGVMDEEISSPLIGLALITTFIGPLLIRAAAHRPKAKKTHKPALKTLTAKK